MFQDGSSHIHISGGIKRKGEKAKMLHLLEQSLMKLLVSSMQPLDLCCVDFPAVTDSGRQCLLTE